MAIDIEKSIRGIKVANINIYREDDIMAKILYGEKYELNDINGRLSNVYVRLEGTKVTYINLPSVSVIDRNRFNTCKHLEEVNLSIATYADLGAFGNCSRLTKVSMPNLAYLGEGGFVSCVALPSITLPNVSIVDQRAFTSCYNLSYIDLPKCSQININAFSRCFRLETLILRSTSVVSMSYVSSTFSSTPMLTSDLLGYYGSIYVPATLVSAYKAHSQWSNLADRITSIEGGGL